MADDWLIASGSAGTGRAPARPPAAVWLKVRYRLTPWWVKVLVIFAVSRVVTTALLLQKASIQDTNAWTAAQPGYLDFAKVWDGTWYFIVAVSGYPNQLPVTDGHVAENAWAFMPGYPFVVRFLMELSGADFAVVAVFVSLAFAVATALLFFKLMARVLPSETAMFAVVLYCFAPLSTLYQVAYAESMGAFLLTLSLYLLVVRRYWMLVPAVIALALTRPLGLAFALALGLHVIYRFVRRHKEPFPMRERVASVFVTIVAGLSGFAWPAIAWAVTGSMTAYTDTELSWRAPYVGFGELVPLTPWIQGANYWIPLPWGPILLAVLVASFIAVMYSPPVRRLGVDIRLWIASFVLYILAVFFPQSSVFRILLPTFPLLGAVAQPKSWIYRLAVVLVFIALQWGWIHIAWWIDGYDWTPP